MGDLALAQRRAIGIPEIQVVVAVSEDQLHHAAQDPNRGWPTYAVIRPMGGPALIVRDPPLVSNNYRILDAVCGWVTGDPTEPPARALAVAGAERVDAGEFRTLDADSGSLRPLVGRDLQVWSLPGQQARVGGKCHEWRLGVRLGSNTSGELPQRIYDLDATPRRIRKAGLQEVTEALRCEGQVGYPHSVATDGRPGFSVMAYQ